MQQSLEAVGINTIVTAQNADPAISPETAVSSYLELMPLIDAKAPVSTGAEIPAKTQEMNSYTKQKANLHGIPKFPVNAAGAFRFSHHPLSSHGMLGWRTLRFAHRCGPCPLR